MSGAEIGAGQLAGEPLEGLRLEDEPLVTGEKARVVGGVRNDLGRAQAIALWGTSGTPISIETSINQGLPGIDIIGLPDAAVSESRKRIRAALSNLGIALRSAKLTVNLQPGAVKKVGTSFDLGIAVTMLVCEGLIPPNRADDVVHCGELGLDGRILPVRGVLPTILTGLEAGFTRFIVPYGNRAEAELVPQAEIIAAGHLADVVDAHGGRAAPSNTEPVPAVPSVRENVIEPTDLADVHGQHDARRALELAAAGGHHLLMSGAPGAGKSMLAACLSGIVPPLTSDERIEVLALQSLAGCVEADELDDVAPPFEAPHHRTTATAMVGGSRPGAIGVFSRAHRGVLFLDEAPEFSRDVLEALRQPLESGSCDIHRAWGSVVLPAKFQLVLAANPCPCGVAGSTQSCSCTPHVRRRYRQKLSGPLLDRVDIQLDVLPVTAADLRRDGPAESSAVVAERVREARERQTRRYADMPWNTNARAPGSYLREAFAFRSSETHILDRALERGLLSMRGYDRVLRIAATIADLAGRQRPDGDDVLAAALLRMREAQ
ncbi:YifB family Mg chelatase-like AAA ATPase [Brevibacterium otitidis]|uniref:YifB family Mg chelatase-like AAA ATPase n=1 Tax=Brevibacterium otitidis TaxID=53364 RepID=A0ABV5X587_9MICO|nr:YifB family Mg chelatase-like AAA ATPase [Brevibacterium otitidis]